MKRVRTEQIQMAVSCYLKRRQYVDSEGPLKQGLRLCQTAEEMAANLTGNPAIFHECFLPARMILVKLNEFTCMYGELPFRRKFASMKLE